MKFAKIRRGEFGATDMSNRYDSFTPVVIINYPVGNN